MNTNNGNGKQDTIVIVNVTGLEPNSPGIAYVGRAFRGWNRSPLGNKHYSGTRKENIEAFRRDLLKAYKTQTGEMYTELMRLVELYNNNRGIPGAIRLGCWCAPLPCHGNVIKRAVERIADLVLEAQVTILQPGNIWSGSDSLAFLTNPTELAFAKGNVAQHYPISYAGIEWADVEAAYQGTKRSIPDKPELREKLLVNLIYCKLVTYPEIAMAIHNSGGVAWLEKCSHFTGAKSSSFSSWEGKGRDSAFIRCLIEAYERVVK